MCIRVWIFDNLVDGARRSAGGATNLVGSSSVVLSVPISRYLLCFCQCSGKSPLSLHFLRVQLCGSVRRYPPFLLSPPFPPFPPLPPVIPETQNICPSLFNHLIASLSLAYCTFGVLPFRTFNIYQTFFT